MNRISIIVPCFNEERVIPLFYHEIYHVLAEINIQYEILFIDDGSTDNTLNVIKSFAESNQSVFYISFSRNFGKEAAVFAGMKHSVGDYIVIMDVDLQDPPSLLPSMLDIIVTQGFDCVATRRTNRIGETPIRSFFARLFYKLINKLSDTKIIDGARDYRMMTRQMVDSILELNEYHRFSKGIFGWVGFQTKFIDYQNIERVGGETKWSFWKLFIYAVDGILSFSTLPLRLASIFGVIFSMIALLLLIGIILRRLIFGDPVAGWASTISVIILIGGLQMVFLGIIGEYIARTYMETKSRPKYFIKNKNIK